MADVTIAGLARLAAVGVETVRFYQRKGLILEPSRQPSGGIRRYGPDAVRRLRFIRAAQAAGFTLEEIGELLDLDARDDRAKARELAAKRIAALDAKIAELTTARAALARLATSCARGGKGPCPILSAFEPKAM
jgi:MerR family transcriptional regulator, mercuric resistance operon regulatory protein